MRVADKSKTTGDGVDTVTAEQSTKHAPATLRIIVDVGDDSDCLPCEGDVRVFDGDCELELTKTDDGFVGAFDLDTALVDVLASPFTCETSCRTYAPVYDSTAVQVTRGCTTDLALTYVPGQSALRATPRLREEDEHGKCVEPGPTVSGVRFRLFVGSQDDGVPLQQVTTDRNPTVSFTDLPPGPVTLVVDAPSRAGATPIELRNPRNATLRIDLGAGQNLVLDDRFEFTPAAGDVTVQVVEDADDRNRLPGIPVRLTRIDNGADGNPEPEYTNNKGVARFRDVPAGTYRVELAVDPVMVSGRTWTTQGAAPAVVVTADDSRGSVELRLVEDLHLVRGTVYGPDGSPAAYALVEIRTAPDDSQPFDTVLTDAAGRYEWEAPNAGQFFLTTAQQDGQLRRVLPVSVNSVAHLDIHTANGFSGSNGGGTSGGDDTFDDDPTPFPLLVGNVDLTTGTAPHGHPGGGGYGDGHGAMRSAGVTVSAAIRDVLGYQTKTTDAKGFVSALQRSFTCYDKTGYTVCEWTPRSYAATIPSDLGALTGAQASIFERAKVAADSIVPLLDGLNPLASDADRQDVDAIRAIVRSRITELVTELSLEGGPRTQRVDELFERLTGRLAGDDPFFNFLNVSGELSVLRDRFGFKREEINTIGEEEDFTNFLIIVDSIASLFATWQQVRVFFDRGLALVDQDNDDNAPFLGTQLVLISRQLGVVTETVKETYFAMDSVFLGPAERQTVLLDLKDEGNLRTTILLSELLDWIDRFVTEEGPHLIEEAGTDGVNAFVPTVTRLATLAVSVANLKRKKNPTVPPTFFTARVQLALQQLAGQLLRTQQLAEAVFERLGQAAGDVVPDNGGTFSTTRRGGRR